MFYWKCESDWLFHHCLSSDGKHVFLERRNYAHFLALKIYVTFQIKLMPLECNLESVLQQKQIHYKSHSFLGLL